MTPAHDFATSHKLRRASNSFTDPRLGTPDSDVLTHETLQPSVNYCAFFRPRHTPRSNFPCLMCYRRPEWVSLPDRWMREYSAAHPGTKKELLELLSGVALIPERLGLLNVMDFPGRGLGAENEDGSGEETCTEDTHRREKDCSVDETKQNEYLSEG